MTEFHFAQSCARATILAGTLLSGAQACWVPAEAGRQMQTDILALRTEVHDNKKGVDEQRASLTEQMRKADRQIEEVSTTLGELNRAARSTDADFGVQLERLVKEVQELRGALELTEYRLAKLESAQEQTTQVVARVEKLEQTKTAPPPAPETLQSKSELLSQAKALVKDGKISDARGVYRDIIKKWPGELGVTDEAYFRLGELYYEEKKQRNALAEYIKVVEKFASGSYADDAYYKIGLCSIDIGNLEDAQIFFGEILKNHKKSPHYKAAQQKLEEVQKRLKDEANKKAAKKK